GQNFAKAFDVKYLNQNNKEEYVWATSWGVSTRLMGALIMVHSDDEGLVLPPKIAPLQVVIVPVPKANGAITEKAEEIMAALRAKGISVKYDKDKKNRPGFKFAQYELEGVPVRLELGKRDLEANKAVVARRDTRTKEDVALDGIADHVENLLNEIQDNLFTKAQKRMQDNTFKVDTWEEFQEVIEKGGFAYAHWDGTVKTELKIKELTKATTRCIPFEDPFGEEIAEGKCILTGEDSARRILFAKAY
ncbi:MAG: His/Gly/Thr/Pro-type tRNA ligase C-terminal domain-containing protein, partial [Saprospiraceae bacterium]|nr:His/Gly/Thr/Pro-type tRNA ligase C-terminal domain-containing protein [Saprospiraceae bacterium]